jgi:nucleotide-binding universal stress UspA family protein
MATQVNQRTLNILLAYDGSQHAQAAIEFIRKLPLPPHSSLSILGVLSPRDSSNHAILEASLEYQVGNFRERDLTVNAEVTVGDPAETLIKYAEKIDPDLLVIGAKGLRATLGILLGGVAQQIIEYASLPVLVVRAPFTGLNKILLLTDGSQCSQVATDYLAGKVSPEGEFLGEHFPLPLNAEVRVMHVLPPSPSPDLLARNWPLGPDLLPTAAFDFRLEQSYLEEEEAAGQALVDKTASRLELAGIHSRGVLVRGDAATEIIDYIKANEIDLIVAGSRGLSAVRSWWLGSVSRKLVHYASCSVLIVKGLPHCANPQEVENLN